MMKPETTKKMSTPAIQGSTSLRTKAMPARSASTAASGWTWWTATMKAASARRTWIEWMGCTRTCGKQ
ncbi:hypothetical protein BTHI11S_00534 [Bosea thiooxidans]